MNPISYEEFGRNFVHHAVTASRVAETIASVAGDVIDVGPLSAGPGGAAEVRARGRIHPIDVRPAGRDDRLAYVATIPVELRLDVTVAGSRHRFDADARVPLDLTVHTLEPLALHIDIDDVDPRDIAVGVRGSGLRSKILQRLGNMNEEVSRHVARFVNDRLASDEAQRHRVIDLLPIIDEVWKPGA